MPRWRQSFARETLDLEGGGHRPGGIVPTMGRRSLSHVIQGRKQIAAPLIPLPPDKARETTRTGGDRTDTARKGGDRRCQVITNSPA